MGSDIKLFRITDYAVALHVTKHPAIEAVLLEDDEPAWMPNLLDEYWLGVSYKDNVAGCFRINKMSRVLYQIHTYFIPGFRRHVGQAAHMIGKWILENLKDMELMIAMIPVCYRNVIMHAENRGFTKCGNLEQAYLKNKKLEDICILSITKKQMQIFVNSEALKWAV